MAGTADDVRTEAETNVVSANDAAGVARTEAETVSELLLNSVIVNRNKSKAKDIVATAFEFILAVITILISENNKYKCTNTPYIYTTVPTAGFGLDGNQKEYPLCSDVTRTPSCTCAVEKDWLSVLTSGISKGAIALGCILIIYVVTVSVGVVIHASRLSSNCITTAEIEEAYEKTNSMAIIDGILEIPLASRFGGKWFVVGAYSILGLTLVALFYILAITACDWGTLAAMLLAILTMYRFTADLCKYCVFTLPENLNAQES
jgi:hypothetical protein